VAFVQIVVASDGVFLSPLTLM